jgi:DNA-directed RNA polymerase specialized sigma24 family protein
MKGDGSRRRVPVADRSDYPLFVQARWTRLLRVAYLLVQDWQAAEDLTQAALVKAWLAWPRVDGDPEAYVRKIIVTTHVSWWRRRRRRGEVTMGQPPERPGAASQMDTATPCGERLDACPRASAPSWCCASSRTSQKHRPPASSGVLSAP